MLKRSAAKVPKIGEELHKYSLRLVQFGLKESGSGFCLNFKFLLSASRVAEASSFALLPIAKAPGGESPSFAADCSRMLNARSSPEWGKTG